MGNTFVTSDCIKLIPDTGDTVSQYNQSLFYKLWQDFVSGGFTVIWKGLADGTKFNDNTNDTKVTQIILESTTAVDKLCDPVTGANVWRIAFIVSDSVNENTIETKIDGTTANKTITLSNRKLVMYYGTRDQIKVVGTNVDLSANPPVLELIPKQLDTAATDPLVVKARVSPDYPNLYRLSITDRGFALVIQVQKYTEDLEKCAVVVIQRGVGCSGQMVQTGKKPLFLFTNVPGIVPTYSGSNGTARGPVASWYYQIVREESLTSQFPEWVLAGNLTSGLYDSASYALLKTSVADSDERQNTIMRSFPVRWFAPVTTETANNNNDYLLIFPYGLSSAKFAYSDELDLIAVSKADAYSSGQLINLDVYGENRGYTSYSSNNRSPGVNNAYGIRVFILTSGGGVS